MRGEEGGGWVVDKGKVLVFMDTFVLFGFLI